MKTAVFLVFTIILLTAIAAVLGFIKTGEPVITSQKMDNNGFALVELFTSEGCSSCPPADKAVEELLQKNNANVFILAFHVDYWNHLGWMDQFSQRRWSQRQNEYASVLQLESVYTPQVIINGQTEFVGSEEKKLNSTVQHYLSEAAREQINIKVEKNKDHLSVQYTLNNTQPVLLNLGLVQQQATSVVKKGENAGKTLHYVNIVRDLKTLEVSGKGITGLDIPPTLSSLPLKIIAFTQNKKDLHVLSATQVTFQ